MQSIKPSDIHFSQGSICQTFDRRSAHRTKTIGETLDDIFYEKCSIESIPRITVMLKDSKWYSVDNRRLWVFRELERLGKISKINVSVSTYNPRVYGKKFTTQNGGISIKVRGGGNPGGTCYRLPNKCNTSISEETISKGRSNNIQTSTKPYMPEVSSCDLSFDFQSKIGLVNYEKANKTNVYSEIIREKTTDEYTKNNDGSANHKAVMMVQNTGLKRTSKDIPINSARSDEKNCKYNSNVINQKSTPTKHISEEKRPPEKIRKQRNNINLGPSTYQLDGYKHDPFISTQTQETQEKLSERVRTSFYEEVVKSPGPVYLALDRADVNASKCDQIKYDSPKRVYSAYGQTQFELSEQVDSAISSLDRVPSAICKTLLESPKQDPSETSQTKLQLSKRFTLAVGKTQLKCSKQSHSAIGQTQLESPERIPSDIVPIKMESSKTVPSAIGQTQLETSKRVYSAFGQPKLISPERDPPAIGQTQLELSKRFPWAVGKQIKESSERVPSEIGKTKLKSPEQVHSTFGQIQLESSERVGSAIRQIQLKSSKRDPSEIGPTNIESPEQVHSVIYESNVYSSRRVNSAFPHTKLEPSGSLELSFKRKEVNSSGRLHSAFDNLSIAKRVRNLPSTKPQTNIERITLCRDASDDDADTEYLRKVRIKLWLKS